MTDDAATVRQLIDSVRLGCAAMPNPPEPAGCPDLAAAQVRLDCSRCGHTVTDIFCREHADALAARAVSIPCGTCWRAGRPYVWLVAVFAASLDAGTPR